MLRSAPHLTVRNVVVAAVILMASGAGAWMLLRPPGVTVATVIRRDLVPVVQGVGTVEAKVVVQVAAKISGRIAAIAVDQGDAVESGRVVVRLDEAQLRAEVARDEAAVLAADAQLRDLLAGARPEEIAEARANVARAEAQLNDVLAGSRQPEIEELRERVASAAATRSLAERDRRRIGELAAKELVAAQDVDRAQQAYDVANAQERGLRQTLALAVAGARKDQIEATRRQLDATRHRLDLLLAGARPQQVEAARAQLRQARAALALARERLVDALIRSPFDGYVVSRALEAGATVNVGTPILKVADPASTWVTAHVEERETGSLAVGDPADVVLRSRPGTLLRGRVARVERESDRVTEQLAVNVVFEERPARLVLGEQAEVLIRSSVRRGVLAAPLSAVVRRPDGSGVLAVRDGRLRFVAAHFGVADTGWIEVLDGLGSSQQSSAERSIVARTLHEGEQVVVAPGGLAEPSSEGRRVTARTGTPGADGRSR